MTKQKTNATSFKKGRAKTGGRQVGKRNKVTRELTESVLEAMDQTGYDGRGQGARIGYLRRLAIKHPPSFASLVARLLPMKLVPSIEVTVKSRDDILKQLKLRNIPVSHVFDPAPVPVLELEAEEVQEEDTPNASADRSRK